MKFRWSLVLLIAGALLTSSCQAQSMNQPEHAVIVHFKYGSTDLAALFALEDKLEQAISAAGAGGFDGDEVATDGSDGYLYMYGPDADKLFDAVKPILDSSPFMKGASVTKRYGPPEDGIRESIVEIAP